jgi:hypothetical protein
MRLLIAIVLSFLVLAGCETMELRKVNFAQSNDRFIGKNADDLVMAKGPPTSAFTFSSGGRVLEYSKSWTEVNGGGYFSPPIYFQKSCKLRFKISTANIVESWSSEGNACY